MKLVLCVLATAACSGPTTPDADAFVSPTALPARLSGTGLYRNVATKEIASDHVEFMPAHELWSDAATKRRWVHLPAGAQIDSRDLDHWLFPVGTKWFKEFVRADRRLETRLIWRVADTGDREVDTLFGAYVWDDVEADAHLRVDGARDVRGTDHDVPDADTCWKCHVGEPGRALGFSAVQLRDVSQLSLSSPPPAGTQLGAPNAALGYLHANCGHCHNPNGGAWASSNVVLRLAADETAATSTAIYQTNVGAPLTHWLGFGYTHRIVAGEPDASAVVYRTAQRASNVQMPPIATEHPDSDGVAVLRAWVQGL
ncbi:MAG: hypothetical protein H0T89_15370 [Deltaproteobacteria bacterium]|nr:hypothetical protein [Deltaproteobacteria bacterium]MDQ3299906.1 hypothetical protein [Myxococcota bacterium]